MNWRLRLLVAFLIVAGYGLAQLKFVTLGTISVMLAIGILMLSPAFPTIGQWWDDCRRDWQAMLHGHIGE
jgi:hypothetical protein